jgi:hypothetical protein
MIDDLATVASLMEQLEADLPIPAYPSKELLRALRQRGTKIGAERLLYIQRVFYLGDEGGIMCDVTPTHDAKTAFVVSLTHLRVPRSTRFRMASALTSGSASGALPSHNSRLRASPVVRDATARRAYSGLPRAV